MRKVKDCLRNFRKKWPVFSWEKNGMDNMRNHIDSLNTLLAGKIPEEMQVCEKQLQKIRRTIRIRRIRSIFGFFCAENKTEEDQYLKETFFDKLFSVALAIRIVFSRFLAIF